MRRQKSPFLHAQIAGPCRTRSSCGSKPPDQLAAETGFLGRISSLEDENCRALRLLARLLVRAYFTDRKPAAPNPLDCETRSNPSLSSMTGDADR